MPIEARMVFAPARLKAFATLQVLSEAMLDMVFFAELHVLKTTKLELQKLSFDISVPVRIPSLSELTWLPYRVWFAPEKNNIVRLNKKSLMEYEL